MPGIPPSRPKKLRRSGEFRRARDSDTEGLPETLSTHNDSPQIPFSLKSKMKSDSPSFSTKPGSIARESGEMESMTRKEDVRFASPREDPRWEQLVTLSPEEQSKIYWDLCYGEKAPISTVSARRRPPARGVYVHQRLFWTMRCLVARHGATVRASMAYHTTHSLTAMALIYLYRRLKQPKVDTRSVMYSSLPADATTFDSPLARKNTGSFCTPQQPAMSSTQSTSNTTHNNDKDSRQRHVKFGPAQTVSFEDCTPVTGGLHPLRIVTLPTDPPVDPPEQVAALQETKANAAQLAEWDTWGGGDADDDDTFVIAQPLSGSFDFEPQENMDNVADCHPLRSYRRRSRCFSPTAKSLLDEPEERHWEEALAVNATDTPRED